MVPSPTPELAYPWRHGVSQSDSHSSSTCWFLFSSIYSWLCGFAACGTSIMRYVKMILILNTYITMKKIHLNTCALHYSSLIMKLSLWKFNIDFADISKLWARFFCHTWCNYFQLIIETLIGGFCPHFLDLCRPNIPNDGTNVGVALAACTRFFTFISPTLL